SSSFTASRRKLFHPFKCFIESLKPSFRLSKSPTVINRPAGDYSERVLNVQHLMIKHIFHYKLRNGRVTQAAAYYDRGVDVIVMTEDAPRRSRTPGEHRALQCSFEIALI